jgi:hypothetical protein
MMMLLLVGIMASIPRGRSLSMPLFMILKTALCIRKRSRTIYLHEDLLK